MRLYTLGLYVFGFNLLLGLFQGITVQGRPVLPSPSTDIRCLPLEEAHKVTSAQQSCVTSPEIGPPAALSADPTGTGLFLNSFVKATVGFPGLLAQLMPGVPVIILGLITGFVWVVYMAGITQLVLRVSFKLFE